MANVPRSPARSPNRAQANASPGGIEDTKLKEKISPWGVKISDEEEIILKRKLSRGGSEIEVAYFTKKGLLNQLKEWGIKAETLDHPEVFTVDQALSHLSNFEGMFAKNLFLWDKKKQLYLFSAPHDVDITLDNLARFVGASGGLRLADTEVLQQKLGVNKGTVTLFGLVNDRSHDVKLILDIRLMDGTYSKVLFHPMVNSATTAISPEGLRTFLKHTGHVPMVINIR